MGSSHCMTHRENVDGCKGMLSYKHPADIDRVGYYKWDVPVWFGNNDQEHLNEFAVLVIILQAQ